MRNAERGFSRRRFLRQCALAAGGSFAPLAFGAAGGEPLRVVFATDIHLMWGDALGSARGLAKCLAAIEALNPRPRFILCGGDLTQELPVMMLDQGEKLLDRFLDLWRNHTDLPTRWTVGNHDLAGTLNAGQRHDDPRFGKGLFSQRLGLERTYYSFNEGAWHFVVLDDVAFEPSGNYVGEFGAAELAFLGDDLKANADRPTALCCHIPGVSSLPAMAGLARSFGMNVRTPSASVARDTPAMLDEIRAASPQVKLVLSGHLHHLEEVGADGIRFINSGAVCANWWKGPQAGCPEGFLVVDFHDDGRVDADYRAYGWKAVSA